MTLAAELGGPGVVVGIVGAAFLGFALLIPIYLLDTNHDGKDTSYTNPIDATVRSAGQGALRNIAKAAGAYRYFRSHRRDVVGCLKSCLLYLAITQLLLAVCFLCLIHANLTADPYGITAIVWQQAIWLAWFPVLTNLCASIVLRQSAHAPSWVKREYSVIILLVAGALVASMIPTAFFNWGYGREEPSATGPDSTVFPYYVYWSRQWSGINSGKNFRSSRTNKKWHLEETHGFQLFVFSACTLTTLVLLHVVKSWTWCCTSARRITDDVFLCLSRSVGLDRGIRLEGLAQLEAGEARTRSRLMVAVRTVSTAVLLLVRFYVDLFTSTLAEISLITLLLAWGFVRLMGNMETGKKALSASEDDSRLSELMAILLAVLPLFFAVISYAQSNSSGKHSSGSQGEKCSSPSPPEINRDATNDLEMASSEPSLEAPMYYSTPWLGGTLVGACGAYILLTIIFFSATFNFYLGWQPHFRLDEVFFSEFALFWGIVALCPVSVFSSILCGLLIAEWNRQENAKQESQDHTEMAAHHWNKCQSWSHCVFGAAVSTAIILTWFLLHLLA